MTEGTYIKRIYRDSLGLLTDLYELTMAYGYWKEGIGDREACFNLFFRRRPFEGTYAIVAGIENALEFIKNFHFDEEDINYLASVKDDANKPLFEKAFLNYLKNFSITLDVDAMEEGTPVFPYEPLIRIQGPLIQAQLMESALLNIINFQTLIATKASRICFAAKPDSVVEFGLRRAQGIDGSIGASRAAFIGGCHATSSVIAGKLFNIPVKGTMAHSWVMAFDQEKEAFQAFSKALPNNCIFLIDTYDSIEGTKNACAIAKQLRAQGIEMLGVRLDSGDLAHLSIEIRKILDREGFPNAKIMASNELDESLIADLKHQGALITIWGVGTNLITAKGQPALDGVYKLSAIKDKKDKWQYRLKISEQMAKVTTPGISQVRRYYTHRGNIADVIYDTHLNATHPLEIVDIITPAQIKKAAPDWHHQDLLLPMMRKGKIVYKSPSLTQMREKTHKELDKFPSSMRRFLNPQPYFVGMEKNLFNLKLAMIEEINRESHS